MKPEEKEFPLEGSDVITDSRERVKKAKLFQGSCAMKGYNVDIMIKKGIEIKKETYDIMKRVQHNTLIPHLNYYPDSNQGRLVIPILETSFETWIKDDGWGLLIDGNGNMTALFKTMIIDICDVIEKLCQQNILIRNLDWKNLYMAKETSPRILLLVTEAETFTTLISRIAIWTPVKDIIEWCYKECKAKRSYDAGRYIGFIGNKDDFNVKSLRRYPEQWDDYTKGDYMLSVVAAKHSYIRSAMRLTDIEWPLENGEIPDLLQQLIDYNSRALEPRYYNPKIPFDYVNLIRNTYKHFDKLPPYIKRRFGTQEGFIKMIEKWTPTIWADLYDEIGWP